MGPQVMTRLQRYHDFKCFAGKREARPAGFEPATRGLEVPGPTFLPVLACPGFPLVYAIFDVFEKLTFLLRTSLY
jgi:hypothetical protein